LMIQLISPRISGIYTHRVLAPWLPRKKSNNRF